MNLHDLGGWLAIFVALGILGCSAYDWRDVDRGVAAANVAAAVADLGSTTYMLQSASCRGRIREGNPLVAFGGRDAVPFVLIGWKVAGRALTYVGGEWAAKTVGGQSGRWWRRAVWTVGTVIDVGATSLNATAVADVCS